MKSMLLCLAAAALLLAGCTPKKAPATAPDAAAAAEGVTYRIGDYYPDANVRFSAPGVVESGTPPIGMVYRIDPANSRDGGVSGTRGYLVSLTEENTPSAKGKGVRWDDEHYHTGATDPNDGRANMATIAAFIAENQKSWANFNSFYWVVTAMNGQTTYETGRDRWFLPSKNELKALYAGFSGRVFDEAWGDGFKMPGFDEQACAEARAAFNAALVMAGGTPLDESEYPYYWSSMEDYDSLAWIVNFRDGGYSLVDSKAYPIRVRAISAF
jgi:hypothetical protein